MEFTSPYHEYKRSSRGRAPASLLLCYLNLYCPPLSPKMRYYKCGDCDKRFSSQTAIDSHCAAKGHSPCCGGCDRQFSSGHAVEQHYHGSSTHRTCRRCDKRFSTVEHLHRHISRGCPW
ncbi:hypothetical protein BKA70DRAFT_1291435 [Coprinopsis sp. MPI-PUGE-AT-0042]|nr:hypothetical protein BKA70DRAFT_1291435 [Coprinopsis sp. MPI-PUGE-AT-0042]